MNPKKMYSMSMIPPDNQEKFIKKFQHKPNNPFKFIEREGRVKLQIGDEIVGTLDNGPGLGHPDLKKIYQINPVETGNPTGQISCHVFEIKTIPDKIPVKLMVEIYNQRITLSVVAPGTGNIIATIRAEGRDQFFCDIDKIIHI